MSFRRRCPGQSRPPIEGIEEGATKMYGLEFPVELPSDTPKG
jgi:hypothetical protein